ncbi:MAG: alpha/beta fold hydrolase [Proteobacteria bacterium]|nr:alpha/beta fold hydrolase [Pseudomonadota bacterium]
MPKLSAGAVSIDCEVRGEGPPLLMINGFRRSRVVWLEGVLKPLSERFQLILMDNRGTGHSDKPQDGYSIEAFADDCAAVISGLGFPAAHVFGVSMGGMIAQRLATRHPQKVRGLALGCTTFGHGSIAPEKRVGDLLRLVPGAGMDAREVARRQEELYYMPEFRQRERALIEGMFDLVSQNPTPLHAVKGHLKAIDAFDGMSDLKQIKAPTLVITGAGDPLFPAENSRLIAARIPGAELAVLPDASHFFWIEKPRETAGALTRFFGKLG